MFLLKFMYNRVITEINQLNPYYNHVKTKHNKVVMKYPAKIYDWNYGL